jgi:Ca2+-binding RTX toxin-like protein
MPLQVIDQNKIGNGTQLTLGTDDDGFVAAGVIVASQNSWAITSGGNDQTLDVQGTVMAATSAVDLGTATGFNQHLIVGEHGYVGNTSTAVAAVVMQGVGNQVDNAGKVRGETYGIEMRGGLPIYQSVINNSGLIEAGDFGIYRDDNGPNNNHQAIHFNNTGEVRVTHAGGAAYYSHTPEAVDQVRNAGLVVGHVELGAGKDIYDGIDGRIEGTVYGGSGDDVLRGGSFADRLFGDGDVDTVGGGDGNDSLGGGSGDDIIGGEAGDDQIDGGAGLDQILGGTGDDFIDGKDDDDLMSGEEGADGIYGGNGRDQAFGGGGDDFLNGEAGDDTLFGDAGNDTIKGGSGKDAISGGDGNDNILGEADDDTLSGDAGNDKLDGGLGKDTMSGGLGDDTLNGNGGDDALRGDAGNDMVNGGGGADSMDGGAGNDSLVVENAGDVVTDTGGGIDLVVSGITFSLADAVHAKGSLEKLTLTGTGNINGTGNGLANTLTGSAGNNTLKAGAGSDAVNGAAGNDRLFGEAGNDVIIGGIGSDRLAGGLGVDKMTGGAQADQFVFDTKPLGLANRDTVTDFQHNVDKLLVDDAVFKGIGAAGALNADFFHVGAAAHDANDRIVYNKATGVLSYDADGTGASAAVQCAVLANKAVVSASDFLVI